MVAKAGTAAQEVTEVVKSPKVAAEVVKAPKVGGMLQALRPVPGGGGVSAGPERDCTPGPCCGPTQPAPHPRTAETMLCQASGCPSVLSGFQGAFPAVAARSATGSAHIGLGSHLS